MDDELTVRGQVCFALYAASRAITDVYRPVLDELGLTYPQYLVLIALGERPDEPSTVGQLGATLQLDSGTLSPLLKRLELAGLVSRRRSERDERVVEVSLTARGRDLRARCATVPRQLAEATGLPVTELVDLRDRLHQLTRAIQPRE
jgi:DNA-binding MarR family transcriptional regulator